MIIGQSLAAVLAFSTPFPTTHALAFTPSLRLPHIATHRLGTVVSSADSKADPFRPARPPLSPMIINALQDLLKDEANDPQAVAGKALAARAADPDYSLTEGEADLLTRRVVQCHAVRKQLMALLEAAVDATPWVRQFGATASIGVGDDKDPYVRACRAECMLAALILHVDGDEVDFLDEERLEVVRDGPPDDAVRLLKQALA